MRHAGDECVKATQRLMDEAIAQMDKQGCPSLDSAYDGQCSYRTKRNGEEVMCAFGPAIEEYNECLEEQAASDLLQDSRDRLHEWARAASPALADRIQQCHDQAAIATQGYKDSDKLFMTNVMANLVMVCELTGLKFNRKPQN